MGEIPGDKFRECNGRHIPCSQRRQVQRLANVARSVPAAVFVLVEVCAAGRKVEKGKARQQGQRPPGGNPAETVACESHLGFRLHYTVSL